MKRKFQTILLFSLIVSLTAQFNISLFTEDFKIALSVICLSACAFLTENFPLIPVTCFSAAGVFLTRMLSHFFRYRSLLSPQALLPEVLFYLCYGMFLWLYVRRLHPDSYGGSQDQETHILRRLPSGLYQEWLPATFFVLFCSDYLANLMELTARLGIQAVSGRMQSGILLVAAVRSFISCFILFVFDKYRQFLLQKERANRYQKLVLLISKLNSEVVWMKKNTSMIEETMNTSYHLFEKLKAADVDSRLTSRALSVSRDIHEIKKEYLLIMRGISEVLEQELTEDGMYFQELLAILKKSLKRVADDKGIELELSIHCACNFYTDKHYALLSVFRNLCVNALEAAVDGFARIDFTEYVKDGVCHISVTDAGSGIDEEDQPSIFEAGFSTKINYETGEISRGLGLNLVQDLVKEELKGDISLSSVPGCTTFFIDIPFYQIEVKTHDEHLSSR